MMGKPKLLVLELWRVGDLAIASAFLRQACQVYEVTLLAQPLATALHRRFWPEVKLVPFVMPWTVFRGKYRFDRWPWCSLLALVRQLRATRFDIALGTRWDPREHLLMWLSGAKQRISYPKLGSQAILTHCLHRAGPLAHRYDDWWVAGNALGISLPARHALVTQDGRASRAILIHSGAASPVRVWPLERYRNLAQRLRQSGHTVRIACDTGQRDWWLRQGEQHVSTPGSIEELLNLLDSAGAFVGNDSGPGHLAALLGVPTFTFFGPQLSEWFIPVHPQAECIDGKPCIYRQCFDYCRFHEPHCIRDITETEAWDRIQSFLSKVFSSRSTAPAMPERPTTAKL
jgi:ADP-heptose:LPS heptosyltransferase